MNARMVPVTCRAVLRAGGLAAGTYALANLLQPVASRGEPPPAAICCSDISHRFIYLGSPSIETNWVIARPPGQTQTRTHLPDRL